ncbi:MAG: hypothetical protein RIQ79_2227, partial [Verrucomicrobiota bacterium]
MSRPIIEVSGLSKRYVLGEIGFSSFREETQRWINRWRGRGSASDKATLGSAATEREFWALRDVSFSINPGDVVGIIGRNGAGKSTLLKILSRITEPTSGEVILRGRVASLLEVGTGFHPELSGRDNIFLNGAILGMKRPEIAAKLDEIIAFAEIEKFIDTPVKRYSSGMYVKLAFAVAAHLEPEILIVDEVLAVGDSRFQQRCVEKMRSLARSRGMTLLFVSHSMGLIRTLCQRGILLSNGAVSCSGDTNEVISRYLSDAVPRDTNLAQRTDRAGSGRVRLQAIILRDASGRPATRFAAGASLCIELHTSASADNLTCFINLMDDLGLPVAHFNSTLFPRGDAVASGSANIMCTIPALHLNDGRYSLNVCLRNEHEFLDDIESAAGFEVELAPAALLGNEAAP